MYEKQGRGLTREVQYPNYKNVLYERGAIPNNLKCIIREARQRPNERGAIPKL